MIKDDINNEGVNKIVIAACSQRVNYDTFDYDPSKYVTERVNLQGTHRLEPDGSGSRRGRSRRREALRRR